MEKRKINIYAKASFILSLFFLVPALNLFTSVLAIVFGITFLKELKKDKNQRGKGLAIAGITIGAVTIFLSLLGFSIYYFFPQLLE